MDPFLPFCPEVAKIGHMKLKARVSLLWSNVLV